MFPTKKKFFKQKSFTFIQMLISLKLIIWYLSRKLVRIESVGKGAAIEKSWAVIGGKRINERASFAYNLSAVHEFFLSAEDGVKSFDKGDCRAYFPSLSLTSELWLWSNGWVPPEFLLTSTLFKNELKWQVGGLPLMTALCAVLRELFLICFCLFSFIEGSALSVINLNYSYCMKSCIWKIVKKTYLKYNKIF